MGTGFRPSVIGTQGIDTDIDDTSFLSVLSVIYPSDDGYHRMIEYVVVHTVLTVEMDGIEIMFAEQVEGMYGGVGIAEKSINMIPSFFFVYTFKALLGDVFVFFHQGFRHDKFLYTVLTGIENGVFAEHIVLKDGVAHLEGRIDEDAVVTVEHFGVHAAHRGADNQVGVFFFTGFVQQVYRFLWMQWEVGGNEFCRR